MRIRRYCHVGTGNYNSSTARLYEDVGILTASPAVGEDLTDLFNFLTGYSRQAAYRQLVVAPLALRSKMIELIEKEGSYGADGRIVWKLNNLVDRKVIDALVHSLAGGHANRSDHPGHVLPSPRRRRPFRKHPCPLAGRALPGALPDFLFR